MKHADTLLQACCRRLTSLWGNLHLHYSNITVALWFMNQQLTFYQWRKKYDFVELPVVHF